MQKEEPTSKKNTELAKIEEDFKNLNLGGNFSGNISTTTTQCPLHLREIKNEKEEDFGQCSSSSSRQPNNSFKTQDHMLLPSILKTNESGVFLKPEIDYNNTPTSRIKQFIAKRVAKSSDESTSNVEEIEKIKNIPVFFEPLVRPVTYQVNMLRVVDVVNRMAADEEAEYNELQELMEMNEVLELRRDWMLFLRRIFRRRSARVFHRRRLFHNTHFKQATGFTCTQAEHLLLRIGHRFRRPTTANWAVSTPQLFVMALRMLRTGNDFWNCGMFGGFSKSTAHLCFGQFVDAVNAELSGLISLDRTEDQWRHQATIYRRRYGISHAVGSLDGTYIKIRNIGDRTNYFCRKSYPALNMTIMVDANNMICFISVRWPGSMHDSTVYRNTDLYDAVERGWEPFPGAVVLADSAYVGLVGDNLLLPHPRNNRITAENAEFYQAHRQARNNVECVIGRLKGKFNILSAERGRINFHTRRKISDTVKCCCILYNFLEEENGNLDDSEVHDDFEDLDPNRPKAEQLIELFNNAI